MVDLNACGSAEVKFRSISETSDLSPINLDQRSDLMVKGLPGKESNGSSVICQATSDHIDGTGSILSVNLIGTTGENTTDNADVAFLWNVSDIDGVIGSHRGGNTFFQHDNSGRLVDVQGHFSVILVHACAFDTNDAACSKVGMWPPILVIPAGPLAVFLPWIVLQHPIGDLLLFASNHLVANVVRNDGDFNFDISVTAR